MQMARHMLKSGASSRGSRGGPKRVGKTENVRQLPSLAFDSKSDPMRHERCWRIWNTGEPDTRPSLAFDLFYHGSPSNQSCIASMIGCDERVSKGVHREFKLVRETKFVKN